LQSGAQVVLWDRQGSALDETLTALRAIGPCDARVVDVTSAADVSEGAQRALLDHGRIDILVNCAGVVGPLTPCVDYSLDNWRYVLDVNLTGVFLCCRSFTPSMVAQGYGRILNVSSIAGKEGNPYQVAYSAAKAGVIALTKVLAKELAETGVLVNAIAPASLDGPLMRSAIAFNPEVAMAATAKIPMGRMGTPEEFAAMANWIVSDGCSFTTGFTFDLSGGRAVY
jgi:3-oxoacyl-[acyl-carrier protein] reductase